MSGVHATTACTAALPCKCAYLLYALPAAAAALVLVALTAPVLLATAPNGTALRTAERGFTVRRKASTSGMVRPFPPKLVRPRLLM
jgi:hypothetical protein